MALDTLYVMISGAGTARRIPHLLPRLIGLAPRVITVLTPNALRIISPRELALVPGHHIVESYFDDAILPRPPRGAIVFAPCGFNSLNKLATGIADNLVLSIAAEAIGRRTPVVVAVSVNPPLWAHPVARKSVATLREWGCDVLEPAAEGEYLTLASDDAIVEAAANSFKGEHS